MVDILRVIVIGKGELSDKLFIACNEVNINSINQINSGTLGNFKTLTYELDINADDIYEKRRKLMNLLAEDKTLMPMYCHGDTMSIYIFKRFDEKPREKHAL